MKTILFLVLIFFTLKTDCQTIDYDNVPPLPTQIWSEPICHNNFDHYFIGYNMLTDEEYIIDTNHYISYLESDFINGSYGDPGEIYGTDDEDNFNNLSKVSSTTAYPCRTVCKLYISFPSTYPQLTGYGTGTLIGENTVITAGHCVFDSDYGGWAKTIDVVPGYYNGHQPYGVASGTNSMSWKGWTVSKNYDDDIGLVRLNKSIGQTTGCLGYGYDSDNFYSSNTFYNLSYPGENPYDGESMYTRKGSFDNVYTSRVTFNKQSFKGQSGSSYYHSNGNVYAVLSGTDLNNTYTKNPRITASKFLDIRSYALGIDIIHGNDLPSIKISPNPTNDIVYLSMDNLTLPITISIYDVSGRKVYYSTKTLEEKIISIPVDNLISGYYYLIIKNKDIMHSLSFIKIK